MPPCGKRFPWSEKIAGRNVRCPCGKVFTCPDTLPQHEEDSYDLAEEPKHNPAPPVQKIAPSVQPLAYATPQKNAQPAVDNSEALKNIYLPLWLLGGGMAVEIIWAVLQSRQNFPSAMLDLGVGVIGTSAIMLVGVLIAAKLRNINLGTLPSAMLKLLAISIATTAVFHIIAPFLVIVPSVYFLPLGQLAGAGAEFCLFFAPMGVLFDLDESDTWYFIRIIALIGIGMYFVRYFASGA